MYKKVEPEEVYRKPGLAVRIGYWFASGNHLEHMLLPITLLVYVTFSMLTGYYSVRDFCPLNDCKGVEVETIGG